MEQNILGIGSRVRHQEFGAGVVINVKQGMYTITFMESGRKEISWNYELEVIEEEEPDTDLVSMFDVERSLIKILRRWSDIQEEVPLGQKWTGGMMLLQPHDKTLKPKEIPIETFFHKITMLRDRLRVMEQKVNSSNMTDEEKVAIQQYITKCYGSLTTFNVLFRRAEDQFAGEKSR